MEEELKQQMEEVGFITRPIRSTPWVKDNPPVSPQAVKRSISDREEQPQFYAVFTKLVETKIPLDFKEALILEKEDFMTQALYVLNNDANYRYKWAELISWVFGTEDVPRQKAVRDIVINYFNQPFPPPNSPKVRRTGYSY